MSVEQSKAVVRRCFEELDRQSLDFLDELCTPGYRVHFPGTPEPMGSEASKPVWSQYFVAFPDLRHTVEDLFAEDDRVVLRMRIRGTHTGEFMGLPPTGRTIALSSINVLRCAGGKVAEQWIEYDALGMLQQLGAIPSPEQPTA
jgi:steroid delta-isomerase-like uncharacterized protein